jgi:hypothetical protein
MMLVRAFALGVFSMGGIAIQPSLASEPSGEAVAVIQSAAITGESGSRPLEAKSPVFMDDIVKTDQAGRAQIRFLDDTRLVVGPNSEITIDKFVFDGRSTASEVTIDAVRGAFRFISGSSQSQAYTINTPTATIGVRGTAFDVTVANGATNLALYDGGVRLCDKTGDNLRCTELTGRCRILILEPQDGFRWVNDIYERTELMKTVFPYAFEQAGLRDEFRVQSRSCNNPKRIKKRKRDKDREPKRCSGKGCD